MWDFELCAYLFTLRMWEREQERENSNSKTVILKDSSVRSIWTYLTASLFYTTNTNKHDNTTREREREMGRERETETERGRERGRGRDNSNSKTLILKDSSVRSIWTYLTASPCYSTK